MTRDTNTALVETRSPFGYIDEVFSGFDNMFGTPTFARRGLIPRLPRFTKQLSALNPLIESIGKSTIKRDGDNWVGLFDIPGVDPKEGLHVKANGDTLSVKAERKVVHDEDGQQGYSSSSYSWEIALPSDISAETEVLAEVSNGVLTITIPGIYAHTPQLEAIDIPVKVIEQ